MFSLEAKIMNFISSIFFSTWVPEGFEDSDDGQPLALSIPELMWKFPYDRLPKDGPVWVGYFLRPEVMLLWIALYLTSTEPLADLVEYFQITGKSTLFRVMVALHNGSLAVFSLVCFIQGTSLIRAHYREFGFEAVYCDQMGNFWSNGFGTWATIFYISKYWEFVDTWILILKGKDPSFLQVYHHSGVVLIMWGAVVSQSPWLNYVVCANSFIHTLMYTYFFIKTIWPKVQIKSAKYLTQAQITQFFGGIFISLGVLYMGERCDSQSSRFALVCLHLYGYGLIALFMAFARKKYSKPKQEVEAPPASAVETSSEPSTTTTEELKKEQ